MRLANLGTSLCGRPLQNLTQTPPGWERKTSDLSTVKSRKLKQISNKVIDMFISLIASFQP